MGINSISDSILCVAQKSSISWVSRMPPIADPAMRRRYRISGKGSSGVGLSGAHENHGPVGFEEVHIGVIVVRCGDGIKDKIKVPL